MRLVHAVNAWCTCTFDDTGAKTGTCAAHTMIDCDQRACDGLLWEWHLRERRIQEEGVTDGDQCGSGRAEPDAGAGG